MKSKKRENRKIIDELKYKVLQFNYKNIKINIRRIKNECCYRR